MAPNAARTAVVLSLLLAGLSATQAQRDYRIHSLDLLRLLADKPWVAHRCDRPINDFGNGVDQDLVTSDDDKGYGGEFRSASEKRSAVGTALNYGRRRREQTPALGKATTPYVGVGVLNNVGSFFDSLRDNLEIAYLPPQRGAIFPDAPSVVQSPVSGGGGGVGSGIRKIHALRPLRPTGNIRSYNRRSIVEADGGYPGANHHDPGLLWTGLGR